MKNSSSIVSIIIPVHNAESYLHKCIESIIQQTYSNIEIIIINDGSTDSSGRMCDVYARKDRRVRAIHQKNSGVSVARNVAMARSKGEAFRSSIIMFLPIYIKLLLIRPKSKENTYE